MTEARLSPAEWQQGRRRILADLAALGGDDAQLSALAGALVAWEALRPAGHPRRVSPCARTYAYALVIDLDPECLGALTPRQLARLLVSLEGAGR